MSTATIESRLDVEWHSMEAPLRLLESAPRFRLLDRPVTVVDDRDESVTYIGIPSDEEIEVL